MKVNFLLVKQLKETHVLSCVLSDIDQRSGELERMTKLPQIVHDFLVIKMIVF